MARYLLKFTKENRMKYLSHLDVLRLFLRAFKRGEIPLSYSKGYNPHAKAGFAIPLSLGFESSGEYLEIETEELCQEEEICRRLDEALPSEVQVLECKRLKDSSKTALAAVLDYAAYKLYYRGDAETAQRLEQSVEPFLKQAQIPVVKYSRKKKKNIENDIRPMIHSVTGVLLEDGLLLSAMLAAGSRANLNPETLAEELCRWAQVSFVRTEWSFRRMEMYYIEGRNQFIPLMEFEG